MSVLDMVRRLALSSMLLFLKPTEQILTAFCVGVITIITAREGA